MNMVLVILISLTVWAGLLTVAVWIILSELKRLDKLCKRTSPKPSAA